jgi:hypothetical protein
MDFSITRTLRAAAEGGDDRAAWRRVSDPHVPGAEEIHRIRRVAGDVDARFDGGDGLLPAHCRSLGHVAGAGADPSGDDLPRGGEFAHVGGDAHVHDGDHGAHLAGQRVDPRPSGDEIGDHLRRHLPGVFAHPLGDDAVIPGHDEDRLPGDGRPQGAGDARQILGKIEETAERPVGHGQRLQTMVRLRPDGGVLGNDSVNGII